MENVSLTVFIILPHHFPFVFETKSLISMLITEPEKSRHSLPPGLSFSQVQIFGVLQYRHQYDCLMSIPRQHSGMGR